MRIQKKSNKLLKLEFSRKTSGTKMPSPSYTDNLRKDGLAGTNLKKLTIQGRHFINITDNPIMIVQSSRSCSFNKLS